ncbi:MAG: hypothetical protein ACP5QK_11935, partial [Myxococcota bacterium]
DKIRGIDGAFKRAIESFNILSSSEMIKCYFQITISGYNIFVIEDILSTLSLYGHCVITFAHKLDLYKNADEDMTVENYKREIINFINKFCKNNKIRELPSIVTVLYLKGMKYFLVNGRLPVRCASLRSTITIDPFGNILTCPYKTTPVVNLEDYEFDPFKMLLTEKGYLLSGKRTRSVICAGRIVRQYLHCLYTPYIFL